jgi:peptidoglycan/xylan/chitin deacetylase (PgdA/CDA1 family)
VQRVAALAEPGAVILLHNGTLETVRSLPAIITALQARGYELVTLADLAHGADGRP